jgi:hypothetical protein
MHGIPGGNMLTWKDRLASIARSGVPHAAKFGRHSLVKFVLKTKIDMPPTFCHVRYFSTFLYGNGNIATV